MTDIYVNDLLADGLEEEGDAAGERGAGAVLVERGDGAAERDERARVQRQQVRDAARQFVPRTIRQRHERIVVAAPRAAEAARDEHAAARAHAGAAAGEPHAAREI